MPRLQLAAGPDQGCLDITVLHSIVTAAQDQLDGAPDPKPLPAAALFKAYDDILPAFGIDPDSDHHLSAFVFRIGGEHGYGTLSDKFHAILGRMGIVLEFGDNTTPSARTSPSLFASPAHSQSSRIDLDNGQRSSDGISSDNGLPSIPDTSTDARDVPALGVAAVRHLGPAPASPGSHDHGYPAEASDGSGAGTPPARLAAQPTDPPLPREPSLRANQPSANDGEEPLSAGRRAALVSAFDRWRSMTAVKAPRERRLGQHGRSRLQRSSGCCRDDLVDGMAAAVDGTYPASPASPPALLIPRQTELGIARQQPHASPSTRPSTAADASREPGRDDLQGPPRDGEVPLSPEDYQRLLHRAARAREIYLASKVFNRWADRTATRLEREAVATRHMIRFRCFRGWSQAPTSKLPAVGNLRAATAVQKLHRAVAYQEEQLSLAASTIATAHRLELAERAFNRWACQVMEHASHRRSARRVKLKAARQCISHAWEDAASRQAAATHNTRYHEAGAAHRWQCQAEQAKRRFAAARRVAAVRLYSAHLEAWLDQAEVKRRSWACCRHLLAEQASTAFYQWNLRARAQAFRWRCEYLSVTSRLDKWLERARQDNQADSAARLRYELASKANMCEQMRCRNRQWSDLGYLHRRARLYIGATHLLKILDGTVKQRKSRARNIVRRYLMIRYTQVSSRRRKRNFYTALNRWHVAAAGALDSVRVADDWRAAIKARRRRANFAGWRRQVAARRRLQAAAQTWYSGAWVKSWDEYSARQGHRNAQAWGLWASQEQRHCLKAWSIATLRRSGQAHTATMVQQRHGRESQSRVLQRWKQSLDEARGSALEPGSASTARPGLLAGYRSGRRSLPSRLWLTRQIEYPTSPMETPTRWTGLAVPMTTNVLSSRPMARVEEVDDESAATSSTMGEAQGWQPRPGRGLGVSLLAAQSPSTTMQAPLPAHLEHKQRLPYRSGPGQLSRSAATRWALGRPDPRPSSSPYRPAARPTGGPGSMRQTPLAHLPGGNKGAFEARGLQLADGQRATVGSKQRAPVAMDCGARPADSS